MSQVTAERLTKELWTSIEDVYAAMLSHPFIKGLADGSLERESFCFYLIQDAQYLRVYARGLALLAAKAPTEPDLVLFARHASWTIEVERALHETFFLDFGLTEQDVATTPTTPTTYAYSNFLLASCYSGSFAEGLGALLPCFWIYGEIGRELLEHRSPEPLYQRWIDKYGGDEYQAIVQELLVLTNRLTVGMGEADRQRMLERFYHGSRYEWMFWDAGYCRQQWPI